MVEQNNKHFPFEVKDVEPEINAAMKAHFYDVQEDGFVRIGPKGYFLPKFYLEVGPKIYNMQTRPDQVFVAGYPRSGTTWTQQLVWLILHNLDYAESEKTTMNDKCKYLEITAVVHQNAIRNHIQRLNLTQENIQFIMNQVLPLDKMLQNHSFFKTHLPLSLLPPNILETSKMVYVARDPRDTVVSLFHFCSGGFWPFKKDFKTMWNLFLQGSMYYCPYFEHVKEYWEMRHHSNLLFLFYEDIQNDRLNTLRRVAEFFNKSYTEEQLIEACEYLDFKVLKNKESFNHSNYKKHGVFKPDAEDFLRKGVVGGWREYFDAEMQREAERWIADNLRGTDLRFPTIPLPE